MSEVDQVLAEAAAVSKKVRVKKEDVAVKEPKVKKVKEPKQYPVWNEDGTQATNEDGSLKFSTERTKKPRVKKEGTGTRSVLDRNLVVHITGEFGAREGSKRAERMAHIVDGATVGEIVAAGGAVKDIVRLQAAGKLSLS